MMLSNGRGQETGLETVAVILMIFAEDLFDGAGGRMEKQVLKARPPSGGKKDRAFSPTTSNQGLATPPPSGFLAGLVPRSNCAQLTLNWEGLQCGRN